VDLSPQSCVAASPFLIQLSALPGLRPEGRSRTSSYKTNRDNGSSIEKGLFNNIRVEFPLKRILAEIDSEGLDEFLRRRQIDNAQIGPVSAPSGNLGYWRWVVTYYRLAVEKLIRRGPSQLTPRS
jgi:hypothetical protein